MEGAGLNRVSRRPHRQRSIIFRDYKEISRQKVSSRFATQVSKSFSWRTLNGNVALTEQLRDTKIHFITVTLIL